MPGRGFFLREKTFKVGLTIRISYYRKVRVPEPYIPDSNLLFKYPPWSYVYNDIFRFYKGFSGLNIAEGYVIELPVKWQYIEMAFREFYLTAYSILNERYNLALYSFIEVITLDI